MYTFKMLTEDGNELCVDFKITQSECGDKPYGIAAYNATDSRDCAKAECRFYTYEEAEKCAEMLVKYQVTPCTLCDIL